MCLMECFSAIKRIQSHYLHQHEETDDLYVKWDEQTQTILYNLIHTWNLKKLISHNLSTQKWLQREDGGEGELQTCWLMGTKLQGACGLWFVPAARSHLLLLWLLLLVLTLHTCVSPLFPPWHFPKVTFQIGR